MKKKLLKRRKSLSLLLVIALLVTLVPAGILAMEEDYVANEEYAYDETYEYDNTDEYVYNDTYATEYEYLKEYEVASEEYVQEYEYEYLLEQVQVVPFGTVMSSGTFGPGGAPWTFYSNGNMVVGAGALNVLRAGGADGTLWHGWTDLERHFTTSVIFTDTVYVAWPETMIMLFNNAFPNIVSFHGLEHIDTSVATHMNGLFTGAHDLTTFNGISGWNTSNVTMTTGMFMMLDSLTTLDLSGWNTSSVTNMGSMFSHTPLLTTLDISTWDTSSVTDMSGMFSRSGITALDLSHFDTSNVTSMHGMFANASSLTSLDLSGWDTSNVTNIHSGMRYMFAGTSSLRELTLGVDFRFVGNNQTIQLPAVYPATPYRWRNVGGGTPADPQGWHMLTTPELIAHHNANPRNETWVWYQLVPTIEVGDQHRRLSAGYAIVSNFTEFSFTTTDIAPGTHSVTIDNLPAGVTLYSARNQSGTRSPGVVSIGQDGRGGFTIVGGSTSVAGVYDNLMLRIGNAVSEPFTLTIFDSRPELDFTITPRQATAAQGDYILVDVRMDVLRDVPWRAVRFGLHYDSTRLELVPYSNEHRVGIRGDWNTGMNLSSNFEPLTDMGFEFANIPATPTGFRSAIFLTYHENAVDVTYAPMEIVLRFRVLDDAPDGIAGIRWWSNSRGDAITRDHDFPLRGNRGMYIARPQAESFGRIMIGEGSAPTEITLTYHANGGTGTMAARGPFERGQLITASPSAFTNPGHIQIGWRLDDPIGGATVPLENSFMIQHEATLYALWMWVGGI
ncbi:MAG: BspA family leucine-rich repeat surface protein [Oscillospiraceae bacterium]|nr:BspA family leucine-rich repeat surface protein [Oscillospiraceae bacterium]